MASLKLITELLLIKESRTFAWQAFLKGMFSVSRINPSTKKIKRLPSETSTSLIYKGKDCFQVKSMEGEWIEIFSTDYWDYNDTGDTVRIKSGWIKWMEGINY